MSNEVTNAKSIAEKYTIALHDIENINDESMDDNTVSADFNSMGRIAKINIVKEFIKIFKYTAVSFLFFVPAIIELLIHKHCIIIHISLWNWCFLISTSIFTFALIKFLVTLFRFFLKDSKLLQYNNIFFLVRLYSNVITLFTSAVIYCTWKYYILGTIDENNRKIPAIISKVLACVITFNSMKLFKNYVVLQIAHKFLWKTYLTKASTSLFSQYIYLLLVNYAKKGYITKADQLVALTFAKNTDPEKISIYALVKIISYVPNKEIDEFNNISVSSNKSAKDFAITLFDMLYEKLNTDVTDKSSNVIYNLLSQKQSYKHVIKNNDSMKISVNCFTKIFITSLFPEVDKFFNSKYFKKIKGNDTRDSINKTNFVDTFIKLYKERKNLSLSIKDYENILHKLGNILSLFIYIITFFIWLLIFNIDIRQLAISWITIFVGLSFAFGSSASAFIESCVFIFITHVYDIGDRVEFVHENITYNAVVKHIDLQHTIFKNWDEKMFTIPNNILSKKIIFNHQKSGNAFISINFDINSSVSVDYINNVTKKLQLWASNQKELTIISESIAISYRTLIDSNKLSITILYQQANNHQDLSKYYQNKDSLTKYLCEILTVDDNRYELPVQPIVIYQNTEEVV